MMEAFTRYYGVDWVAMVLTFVALYFIGNKERKGFVIMMSGNLCWVSLGVFTASIGMILANLVFFGMNTRALVKWSSDSLKRA